MIRSSTQIKYANLRSQVSDMYYLSHVTNNYHHRMKIEISISARAELHSLSGVVHDDGCGACCFWHTDGDGDGGWGDAEGVL